MSGDTIRVSLADRVSALIPAALRTRFNSLAPRERIIVSWGVLIVLLLLIYALVWLPAYRSIESLERARSNNSATLAELQAASTEAKTLRTAQSAMQLKPNSDLAQLRAALAQSGVEVNTVDLQLEGTSNVRFASQRVSAGAWLNWLATVQREYALVLREAQIVPLQPLERGEVRVTAQLARAR
jgi:general secretion pathway protein M